MQNSIRIAIADDHAMFRQALVSVINNFDNCSVAFEAGNGMELKKLLKVETLPEIILLDLHMPVMNGYKTLEWLNKEHPSIKVIILSMCDSDFSTIRLLKAGAKAYLRKNTCIEELKKAIYDVNDKGYYYTDNVTRKLFNVLYNDSNAEFDFNHYTISEKEIQFLQLSSTDLTYKEIANELKLSPRGVDKIRDKLFYKLNAKNRVTLVIKAILIGIADNIF